jgi:hypothetical protein
MSQVNPEDVKTFLQQQDQGNTNTEVTTESQMPGHKVVNLEEARKQAEEEQAKIKDLQERVEEDRNKLFEPDMASLSHLSSWAFDNGNLKVEVDNQDKALYLKSLLNDVPLELNIKLEMGISFVIRATTNYDLDIIFKTLEKYSEESKIPGPAQYASLVQKCAAALQIVKVGDINMDPPKFVYGKSSVEADANLLKERIETILGGWAWPKWNAALTALRVFEAKLAMCNENARQSNFWQTADAN